MSLKVENILIEFNYKLPAIPSTALKKSDISEPVFRRLMKIFADCPEQPTSVEANLALIVGVTCCLVGGAIPSVGLLGVISLVAFGILRNQYNQNLAIYNKKFEYADGLWRDFIHHSLPLLLSNDICCFMMRLNPIDPTQAEILEKPEMKEAFRLMSFDQISTAAQMAGKITSRRSSEFIKRHGERYGSHVRVTFEIIGKFWKELKKLNDVAKHVAVFEDPANRESFMSIPHLLRGGIERVRGPLCKEDRTTLQSYLGALTPDINQKLADQCFTIKFIQPGVFYESMMVSKKFLRKHSQFFRDLHEPELRPCVSIGTFKAFIEFLESEGESISVKNCIAVTNCVFDYKARDFYKVCFNFIISNLDELTNDQLTCLAPGVFSGFVQRTGKIADKIKGEYVLGDISRLSSRVAKVKLFSDHVGLKSLTKVLLFKLDNHTNKMQWDELQEYQDALVEAHEVCGDAEGAERLTNPPGVDEDPSNYADSSSGSASSAFATFEEDLQLD